MTEHTNAAISALGMRQDRHVGQGRESLGLNTREHYEPTTLAAPDVNGDDRTIVVKPRRYVAVQLDGAGGPVTIELSVEQAQAVGRALIDAATKLDTPHAF
jgi:hypothetical protein